MTAASPTATSFPAVRPRVRLALAAAQWLFVALLLLQIYLAGAFLMWDGEYRDMHVGIGWLLTYYPFLTLALAAFARMPRAFWASFAVLFVAIHVQPFLALIPPADGWGWLRAVHPVNAVLVLALAYQQARMAGQRHSITSGDSE